MKFITSLFSDICPHFLDLKGFVVSKTQIDSLGGPAAGLNPCLSILSNGRMNLVQCCQLGLSSDNCTPRTTHTA